MLPDLQAAGVQGVLMWNDQGENTWFYYIGTPGVTIPVLEVSYDMGLAIINAWNASMYGSSAATPVAPPTVQPAGSGPAGDTFVWVLSAVLLAKLGNGILEAI